VRLWTGSKQLVSNNTFLFFFAVIGIPMICMSMTEIVKLLIKHRERMAMIEHGMIRMQLNQTPRRKEALQRRCPIRMPK